MKRSSNGKTTTHGARDRSAEYATPEEFCSHFTNQMGELYSLSLALTADHARAEECFLSALEDCRKASVFKQWEHSWSRLAIIENAIRIVKPVLENVAGAFGKSGDVPEGIHAEAAPVMRLNAFHRFVYVLSVLDRYSTRDCAVLLKCAWQDIERARRRAFEFIASPGTPLRAPGLQAFQVRPSA